MMRLIILTAILPVMAIAAPWDLKPFGDQYDRGNQAVSAAVERLSVVAGPWAWTNYAITNIYAGYFKQATKLRAAKNMLGAALDQVWYIKVDTNYNSLNYVYLDRALVLSNAGAPSSWFTNTPYFNLAVETNGWRFLPAVCSQMVWTLYLDIGESVSTTGGAKYAWVTNGGASYGATYSIANSTGPTSTNAPDGLYANAENYSGPSSNTIVAYRSWQWLSYKPTNDFSADIIIHAWLEPPFAADPEYNGLTDWNGTNYLAYSAGLGVYAVAVTNYSRLAGATNEPSFPFGSGGTTCPSNTTETVNRTQGWQFNSYGVHPILHKHNATTNGFKWFR
jgi:hypothetical protein